MGQIALAKAVEDKPARMTQRLRKADRDVLALGIACAAIVLFVTTGGTVMPKIVRAWMGVGEAPDIALTNAVLLNIALLIFGWRRYRDLHSEVAERRQAEQRAQQLADTDELTGCLNRRSGVPAIDKILSAAHSSKEHIALFMIDLDNFKQINDLNGHKFGDLVLATVAKRVRALLPKNALLARIGGDEFVCAIPHPARASERMERIAEQVICAVSEPIEHKSGIIEPTISIGMVSTDQDSTDTKLEADALIHRADIAMYHAKKNGRNRYFWFEAQMEDEIRLRNELETGIRNGISKGEFIPYYEQQIDLETGKLVGFEMLARWNSPKYGLVKPEVFIPIAEEIDLISELSEKLVEQALRDANAWDPRLTLSINISPLQLQDPWFAQRLLQMLIDAGFPPNRLEIEITESCLHQNIGAVRSIVTSLKNQGVRISLDDFGTGFSSLSQLRTLPFDRIKIDRSFVADLGEDEASNELVEAIISLGRGMSLPITAEGIENARALDALKAMGELKGQGYLYGRPEDANTTRNRLAELDLLTGEKAAEIAMAASEDLDERKVG